MTTIEVKTRIKQYQIKIVADGLQQLGSLVTAVWQPSQVAVVTDSNVGLHYAQLVTDELTAAGFKVLVLTIPAGESSKSWQQVQLLIEQLSAAHFSRSDGILALGGGVVGDLAGFVASIYMRGIGLIQVPTSLLAQVDSSVGGKTAIDLPTGKNLVGSFYQPDLVIIDPTTLTTLPPRMLAEGYGEVVKCAALVGGDFWQALQPISGVAAILPAAPALIAASVAFKAQIVMADEQEQGQRQRLNLGHTIGHAVELLANGQLMHGEAVAIGLVQVCRLFAAHDLAPASLVTTIKSRLMAVGLPTELPTELPAVSQQAVVAVMQHDKKVHGAALTWVYLTSIGQPQLFPVAIKDLNDWLATLWVAV
ncbi:3-dehydroquinate synthase [Lactiplantibacillus paraplantarum]|uniref:3-dehydroquinate synthase n=1 Tax=Lactiplantibacillus paraplantarum TaxID=60520 RepID=UPI002222A459|nr:3-dehydroquinate synthase [Lactiplantibacillus paraplantarum]MCW1909688.1 3-dehydroquinate synthase [Lactiplantibacillus paraplantarum]